MATRDIQYATVSTTDKPNIDARVTQSRQLLVIKRDGRGIPYDASRIAIAMKKAFLAVEGDAAHDSSQIQEPVARLTDEITTQFHQRHPSSGVVHIETIQDKVELTLMYA